MSLAKTILQYHRLWLKHKRIKNGKLKRDIRAIRQKLNKREWIELDTPIGTPNKDRLLSKRPDYSNINDPPF